MSPANVKVFSHSLWQNMQKIKTMFPLQRVKLCGSPIKGKDGVLKQDWDEYIGHGLNNKHWVLEKFKWSNPFYTPKLSAKICKKRYRRHMLSSKHLLGSLKELVGKRLGCLCSNIDECHGNVLIELVHEFFPLESEMRGYILCNQYLFFKGQRSPL